jgi:hypothetical protein
MAQSRHRLVHCICLLLTQSGHPSGAAPIAVFGGKRHFANVRNADIGIDDHLRHSSQIRREWSTSALCNEDIADGRKSSLAMSDHY